MMTESRRVKRSRLEAVFRARVENLRSLVRVYGSQAALGRALDVSPAHMTHILGDNPIRVVGENAARDYEVKLGLPSGWLDITR